MGNRYDVIASNAANFLVVNDDRADRAKGPLGSGKLLPLPFLKFFNKDRCTPFERLPSRFLRKFFRSVPHACSAKSHVCY